jgi:hypothetical protein
VNYSLAFPHPRTTRQQQQRRLGRRRTDQRLDCNDASSSFLWPATEVQNEQITGKPFSTISWDSQASFAGSGVTYDVVRGACRS